jgi:hypothetical protein
MKFMRSLGILLVLILMVETAPAEFKEAPPGQISQAIISACLFEKTISTKDNITIYVMGSEEIASSLQMYLNQSLGNATLKKIDSGNKIPANTPTILFLGNRDLVGQASSYCQENGVLSITNIPDLVSKGISLGVGIDESGSLGLLLNPGETAREGKNWKPAIMKMARIVK